MNRIIILPIFALALATMACLVQVTPTLPPVPTALPPTDTPIPPTATATPVTTGALTLTPAGWATAAAILTARSPRRSPTSLTRTW